MDFQSMRLWFLLFPQKLISLNINETIILLYLNVCYYCDCGYRIYTFIQMFLSYLNIFFIIECYVCFRRSFKSMLGKKAFKLHQCELYWCEYEILKSLRKHKNDFISNYCNNIYLCVHVTRIIINVYAYTLKGVWRRKRLYCSARYFLI